MSQSYDTSGNADLSHGTNNTTGSGRGSNVKQSAKGLMKAADTLRKDLNHYADNNLKTGSAYRNSHGQPATTHTTTTNADNTVTHHHHHHYYTAPGQGPSSGPMGSGNGANFAHDSQASSINSPAHDVSGTSSGVNSYNTAPSHTDSSVPSHQMSGMNLGGNNGMRHHNQNDYTTDQHATVGEKLNPMRDTSGSNNTSGHGDNFGPGSNNQNSDFGSHLGNQRSGLDANTSSQHTSFNPNARHHNAGSDAYTGSPNSDFDSSARTSHHSSDFAAASHGTGAYRDNANQADQKTTLLDKMNPMKDTSGMSVGSTSNTSGRGSNTDSYNTGYGSNTNTHSTDFDSNTHNTTSGSSTHNSTLNPSTHDTGLGSSTHNNGFQQANAHSSVQNATVGQKLDPRQNTSGMNTSNNAGPGMLPDNHNDGYGSNTGHTGHRTNSSNQSSGIRSDVHQHNDSIGSSNTHAPGLQHRNENMHSSSAHNDSIQQTGHKVTLGEKLNPMKDTSGMKVGSRTDEYGNTARTDSTRPMHQETGTGTHSKSHHSSTGALPDSNTTGTGIHTGGSVNQDRSTNFDQYNNATGTPSEHHNVSSGMRAENLQTGTGFNNHNDRARHQDAVNVTGAGFPAGTQHTGTGHHTDHHSGHHVGHNPGNNTTQVAGNHTTTWDDPYDSRVSNTNAHVGDTLNPLRNTSGPNTSSSTSHQSNVGTGLYPGHTTTDSRDAMSGVNTHTKAHELTSSSSNAGRHGTSNVTHGGSQLSPSGTGVGTMNSNDQTSRIPDPPRGHATIGEKLNPFKDTSGMKMTTSSAKAHEGDVSNDHNTAGNRASSGAARKPVATTGTTGSPSTRSGVNHTNSGLSNDALPTRTSGFEHAGPGYDRTANTNNTGNVNSGHTGMGSGFAAGAATSGSEYGAHGANTTNFGHGQSHGNFGHAHTGVDNNNSMHNSSNPNRQYDTTKITNPGVGSKTGIDSSTGVGSHTGSASSDHTLTSSNTPQSSHTGFGSNSNYGSNLAGGPKTGYGPTSSMDSPLHAGGTHGQSHFGSSTGVGNGHGGSRYYQPTETDRRLNGEDGLGAHPTMSEKLNPLKDTSGTSNNASAVHNSTTGSVHNTSAIGHNTTGTGYTNTAYGQNPSPSSSHNSHHHGHDNGSSVSDMTSNSGSNTNRHSSGSEKPSMGQRMKAALTGSSGHKTTGGSSTTTPGSGGMQTTQTVRDETGTYEVRRVA